MFSIDNTSLTYFEVLKRASSFLEENKRPSFAAEWLLRERLDWSKTELVTKFHQKISDKEREQFIQDINSFVEGYPMQQIIGHDWFYDRKFLVNEHTLIPRPETEEWLDQVLAVLPRRPLKVLDIGTGSGVLAITEKLERPDDLVVATDISKEALKMAQKNAQLLGAEVTFKEGNLFEPVADEQFDLILCNPPYISVDEVDLMDQSVLEHEPDLALFAKEQGLFIYYELAKKIKNHLTADAFIFLEIGYLQAKKVMEIFKKALPTATVESWRDFNQNDRVIAIYVNNGDKSCG